MGMCARIVVSLHYNKDLQQFYAIMRYEDGEPGEFIQQFSQELFFGWYTMLTQEATRNGQVVETSLTDNNVTNWFMVTQVGVTNDTAFDFVFSNQLNNAVFVGGPGQTEPFTKIADGGSYTINSPLANGSTYEWETLLNGVFVEGDSGSFADGQTQFTPTIYDYNEIRIFNITPVEIVEVRNAGLDASFLTVIPCDNLNIPNGIPAFIPNDTDTANCDKSLFYNVSCNQSAASVVAATVIEFRTFLGVALVESLDITSEMQGDGFRNISLTDPAFDNIVIVADPV